MRRAFRASAVVAACVVLVAGACVAPSAFAQVAARGGSLVARSWEAIEDGGDVFAALESEGIVRITEENTPAWLEDEIMPLSEMDQAISNGSFELVWFLRKGSAEDAVAFVAETLASKGWASCGVGSEGIESFVKDKGDCTWVMAECAQAGDEAAIVLRIRHT